MLFRYAHIKTDIGKNKQGLSGQALTEFLIGSVFVMVPLFLLISIAGKYADIKYASVQAARYEAWEFTANYVNINEQPSGFTSVSNSRLPQKSATQVQRESRRRFFSDTSTTLSSRFDRAGYIASEANPLWRYHDGQEMYDPLAIDTASRTRGSETTPDPTNVISGIIGVADAVFGALASVLSAIGANAGFDALNEDGYASSIVSTPIENAPDYSYLDDARSSLLLEDRNLTFAARASVLTDSWSAGGTSHTMYQARGLVPTTLLDVLLNPGGFPLQDIAAYGLLTPELRRSSLRFGQMIDIIPEDKIEGGSAHSCTDGGYCEY